MDIPRTRRRAGVVCLLAGPALLLASTVVLPWIGDGDAKKTLATAAANQTATNAGDLLLLLGLLLTIPAALVVMRLLEDRAPALGLLGGGLLVAGLVGGMLTVVTDQVNVGIAGAPDIRDRAAAAFDGSSAWALGVVLVVMLVGATLGPILLGAGLLRGRAAPVWAGCALIAWPVLSLVAHAVDAKLLDAAAGAVGLAGFAGVALAVSGRPARETATAAVGGASYPATLGDHTPAV